MHIGRLAAVLALSICVAACAKAATAAPVQLAQASQPPAGMARDFPRLDVGPTCRSASDRQRCLDEEGAAREQLAKSWEQFAGGDRTSCTQTVSSIAGAESYVELLTCLQMARDARKLPKE